MNRLEQSVRPGQMALDLPLHLYRDAILNKEFYLDSLSHPVVVEIQKKAQLCVFVLWQRKKRGEKEMMRESHTELFILMCTKLGGNMILD